MNGDPGADPATVFRNLQTLLLQFDDMSAFLRRLAGVAARASDPPVSCGVTLRYDDEPMTVASSDDLAASLDESQYTQGDGPCLTAMSTGETVEVNDPLIDGRWPAYLRELRSLGVGSVLAIPLRVGDGHVGALNLYVTGPPARFPPRMRRTYISFAELAAAAVEIAVIRVQDEATRAHLELALASRSAIDQAMGILMALQRCTAEEAFALLRKRSQASNTPLRRVAEAVIQRTTGRPVGPPRSFDEGSRGDSMA